MLVQVNQFINKYILLNIVWFYVFYKDLNIKAEDLTSSNIYIIFKFFQFDERLQKCIKLFCIFISVICLVIFLNILKVHNFNDPEEVVGICLIITFFSLVLILNEYMASSYLTDYIYKYNKLVLYEYVSYLYECDSDRLNDEYLKVLTIINELLSVKQYYYNFLPYLKRKWNVRKMHILWYLQSKLILKTLSMFLDERRASKFILSKYIVLFKIMLLFNNN